MRRRRSNEEAATDLDVVAHTGADRQHCRVWWGYQRNANDNVNAYNGTNTYY
jgi:hypothetical protein